MNILYFHLTNGKQRTFKKFLRIATSSSLLKNFSCESNIIAVALLSKKTSKRFNNISF